MNVLLSLLCFFTGEETIDGVLTEKWKLTQTIGQKVNKYTMWIFYKPDPNNENVKVAVPKRFVFRNFLVIFQILFFIIFRYEMQGFNSLLGSHYDHYYLDYDFYDINEIPKDTFKISTSKYVITAGLSKLLHKT